MPDPNGRALDHRGGLDPTPLDLDVVTAFDRIVCLVDGSAAGFDALRLTRTLAAPWTRIVAIVPVDVAAASTARCQTLSLTAAWQRQAETIRTRAAAGLRNSWGYARVIEGQRIATLVTAAEEEGGTMIVVAGSSLRRGDARRLLLRTSSSILISREGMNVERLLATEGEPTGLVESLAARLQARVMLLGPACRTARAIHSSSRPGDLIVIDADCHPRRWPRSRAESVAARAPASVLLFRPHPAERGDHTALVDGSRPLRGRTFCR